MKNKTFERVKMSEDFHDWINQIYSSLSNPPKLLNLYKDLIDAINSIRETGFLNIHNFKDKTDEFIDDYSPRIISEILNLSPNEQIYSQNLNRILNSYIQLIPLYLFTDHKKFIKMANKIIVEKDYPFYTATSSLSFLSSSSFYSMNLKTFVHTNIINISSNFFDQNANIPFDTFYTVINLINKIKSECNKKHLHAFYKSFSKAFLNRIDKLEQQEFRDLNETQISSIYNIIEDFNHKDSQTLEKISSSKMNFCLKMLNSSYLNKQFCALQTLKNMDEAPEDIFVKIKEDQIVEKMYKNLHKELFPAFCWLVKTMISKGYLQSSFLIDFWEATLTNYTSCIDSWSDIITELKSEIWETFWNHLAQEKSFPINAYPFLRKISVKANDSQKKKIFLSLYNQVFSQNLSNEIENAIVLTVAFYLPKDPEFKQNIIDKSINMIQENIHVSFALNILKKLAFYFNSHDSRELFHKFLDIKPDLSIATSQYMEFFVGILRHFDSIITEDEAQLFQELIAKILPEKSLQVQKFFEDIARTQKIIFPPSLFKNYIHKLCETESPCDEYIDLLLCLFKQVNSDLFESKLLFNELWIKSTKKLICIDEIWNFLYKTSSLKVASFLCNLYSNCRENESLRSFVKRCIHDPGSYGSLAALVECIDRREALDASSLCNHINTNTSNNKNENGIKVNKWRTISHRPSFVKVKVIGDFIGYFLLPTEIQSQKLKTCISNFLLLRPDLFTVKLDESTLPADTLTLTNKSVLKISCKDTYYVYEKPTDFITKEDLKLLIKLLSSNESKISETALKIANMMPPEETELSFLTSILDIPEQNFESIWMKIFDSTHVYLLLYRLNTIGNLLSFNNKWKSIFIAQGGATFMYKKLVIEEKIYRINPIVLTIFDSLINSKEKIFTSFSRKDFEVLVDLIYFEVLQNESNTEYLFHILKSAAIHQKNELFCIEKFDDIVSKSIFHHNKHFREVIASIISLSNNKIDILIKLLPSSDSPFANNYYKVFEATIFELNDDEKNENLFYKLFNIMVSHFGDLKDMRKLLYLPPPNEPFVNGIILLLFKLYEKLKKNKKSFSSTTELLKFMIKYIVFHPIYYFPLSESFFSFMKMLAHESDINKKVLLKKMLKAHQNNDLSKHHSNSNFTSSHNRKGLRNLGATCYANSVFQQLFNVIEFRYNFLKADCDQILDTLINKINKNNKIKQDPEAEIKWIFELQMIFAKLMFYPSTFINPNSFFKVWRGWDGNPVRTYEQQDAVEFLQLIIDQIDEKIPHIADVFKGKIQHDTYGVGVEYHTQSEENFTTLPLEVCDQKDIEESLTTFLLPDYHNDYNAENIGKIDVQRYHKISEAPNILIIQLKRFSYDLKNHCRIKITKKFDFPHHLDITRMMVNQENRVEYDLIGVVVHIGNANAGHYFSYCKDINNQWICCNDSLVKKFDGSLLPKVAAGENMTGNLRDDTAYILFYRKSNIKLDNFSSVTDCYINNKVIVSLVNKIQAALLYSVLTSNSYAQFVYSFCDSYDNGEFLFTYIVKCLKLSSDRTTIDKFYDKCTTLIKESKEFANYIISQHEYIISMLLDNNHQITREKFAHLLCYAMEIANNIESQNLIKYLKGQLNNSISYWENYDEFFLPFLQSVNIDASSSLLPDIFEFLQTAIPDYARAHSLEPLYQKINLNCLFKLLVVLLSSSATKSDYKTIVFSNSFLNKWIQSPHHALTFSQLLRSFVIDYPELSSVYFKFLVENAAELSPESAAGHFAVLINSQSLCDDEQVLWCFSFLRTKSTLYSRIFFEQLTQKILESKIDFTKPLLLHGNLWIDEWLLSLDIDLRKATRKLVIAVFSGSKQHAAELFKLLISKLSTLTSITSKRRKDIYLVTHGMRPENSLPTNTFYSLLSWTVKEGSLYDELAESSSQLVDALLAHKTLQLIDNFPMQRLVEVIMLIPLCSVQNLHFFKFVSTKKFLSAFSFIDCSIDDNAEMVFNALKFVAALGFNSIEKHSITNNNVNSIAIEIAKSEAFSNLSETVFLSESFVSDHFVDYLYALINKSSAIYIASTLWQKHFHNILTQNNFFSITKLLLLINPGTSNVFMKMKCHIFIINTIQNEVKSFKKTLSPKSSSSDVQKNHSITSKTLELLRIFTDAFVSENLNKKTWYYANKIDPIINFWSKYLLLLSDLIQIIAKNGDDIDSSIVDEMIMLLKCVVLLKDEFAIFIFEQLVLQHGILSLVTKQSRHSISILIDILANRLQTNKEKRSRVFELLLNEFCTVIDDKNYDNIILETLYRRITIFSDIDSTLQLTNKYKLKYKLWCEQQS